MPRGHVGEECAVGPDADADAVGVGRGQELAGRGECERCAGALEAHGVDEVASREVPNADDGVHRRGDNPAPVRREAEVANLADAAPKLAYELAGLDVDDPKGEVIAGEGDEVAGAVVLYTSDGGHGVPVDFVAEVAGEEVPEFDLAVEAAAYDGSVEAIDKDASHVFRMFAFAGIEFVWSCNA